MPNKSIRITTFGPPPPKPARAWSPARTNMSNKPIIYGIPKLTIVTAELAVTAEAVEAR